uniref:Histone acetyltransferase type B catalytic subunit n=1 Tax=Rhabditophanes sp. KR3021 TaxID=114890 RepID=A0AC35THA2_9BILA
MATIGDDCKSILDSVMANATAKLLAPLKQQMDEESPADDETPVPEEEVEWISDALEVIKIHFIQTVGQMEASEGYAPLFTNQHFEKEEIFGYKDLKVDLYYSACSMFLYPKITFSQCSKDVITSREPDDILILLKNQLPNWHMGMLIENFSEFEVELRKQVEVVPVSPLISRFTKGDKTFAIFKPPSQSCNRESLYITRLQSLALFYIEAANYTDNEDPRCETYILYETVESAHSKEASFFAAGYCTLFNFYHYPDQVRPRIAQFLLFGPYRGLGAGPELLSRLSTDIISSNNVFDITAEDPCDFFIYTRDFVNCQNLFQTEEFSKEKVVQGFSKDMMEMAQKRFGISKKDCRRSYEILRYNYTDVNNVDEFKNFRIEVKRSLSKSHMKKPKEIERIAYMAQNDKTFAPALQAEQPAMKFPKLQGLFEKVIQEYGAVLNRLKRFVPEFD